MTFRGILKDPHENGQSFEYRVGSEKLFVYLGVKIIDLFGIFCQSKRFIIDLIPTFLIDIFSHNFCFSHAGMLVPHEDMSEA